MDRAIDAPQQSFIGDNAIARRNGMHFPTGWDPYFRDFMTLADVYRYPGQHSIHHRRQLTHGEPQLSSIQATAEDRPHWVGCRRCLGADYSLY